MQKIFFGAVLAAVAVCAFVAFGVGDTPRGSTLVEVQPQGSSRLNLVEPQSRSDLQKEQLVDYAAVLKAFRGKDIEFVPMEEKLIALSFDAGGNADGVTAISQTLTRLGVPATFFLTGKFMEQFPDAIAAIAKVPGSEFANHSYSHSDFIKLTAEERREEIRKVETLAKKRNITIAPFFRFPYGARNAETIAAANEAGYTAVRWTVDSLGWQGLQQRDPVSDEVQRDSTSGSLEVEPQLRLNLVVDRVVSHARNGGIILMHAGSAADKSTLDADALPEIISKLSAQGYRFTTLSELFAEIKP